jgi:transposase-like protein
MEKNIPEGFAVFSLPIPHQRRMRTSNALKRVNQELKRRTRVASLFPNEASLLRLTWKSYLNMNPADLPQN